MEGIDKVAKRLQEERGKVADIIRQEFADRYVAAALLIDMYMEFSHNEWYLCATQECSSTSFASSQLRYNKHACKTSAHVQGLYFQNGGCECELHNKNAFFELKSNFISIRNFKAGNVKPPGMHWSKDF